MLIIHFNSSFLLHDKFLKCCRVDGKYHISNKTVQRDAGCSVCTLYSQLMLGESSSLYVGSVDVLCSSKTHCLGPVSC